MRSSPPQCTDGKLANRQILKSLSVSKNGEKTREYVYNKINNLMSSTVDGVTTTYAYNGDRLRESKTTNGVTTRHIYDGTDVVADVTGDTTTNFVRGIGLIYSENMTTGDKRKYALNAHGDVAKRINADGTAEKFNYRAYGIGIVGTPDPFGYCGEYTDSETGLIYLRNRYYDPELGRFINVDPIFSGANWYAYCEGNPVRYVDPSGCISLVFCADVMLDQAKFRKGYYAEKYGTETYVIPISSAGDFVTEWNDRAKRYTESGEKIDAIEIISHGSIDGDVGKDEFGTAYSTGYLFFQHHVKKNGLYARTTNSMASGDHSIDELLHMSADEININGCNSANSDTYNVVYGLMKKTTANSYTGFDGGASWDESSHDHTRGGGDYSPGRASYLGGPWYYVKTYQSTWWKYVTKSNGEPIRKRTGRRYFPSSSGGSR